MAGERYAPDVAFLAKARQPEIDKEGYNHIAPDLAVEIESFTDSKSLNRLRVKITNYLAAGTTVWAIFYDIERVEIHAPGQPVIILGADDSLDGDPVLPDFKLNLRAIFPKQS